MVSGLAKPEQYPAIRDVFRKHEHSSPYMEKYVAEAQYQMRFEADAIARAKKRYKFMTDHKYTTLFEGWGIGSDGFGGGTINHAWCGGMLTLLSQYGAGVAPITPGYDSYHVMPQMGPLKYIQTVVPSVKGDIVLYIQAQPDVFTIDLISPENTVAIVGLPKRGAATAKQIIANGQIVWASGQVRRRIEGLRFLRETEHYVQFSAQPGNWKFSATY